MTRHIDNTPLRSASLAMSMVGWLACELFWFPLRASRGGIHSSVRNIGQALRGWHKVERWRRGMLPRAAFRGGSFFSELPSGRQAKLGLNLVGGEANLALLDLWVDGESVGVFNVWADADKNAKAEIKTDAQTVPCHAANQHLHQLLPEDDALAATRMVSWLSAIITP